MSELSLVLDTPELARQYEQMSVDCQFRGGCELIDALAVKAGEHVLDVGAGTGLIAAHVADIVGDRGAVTGIDPLPLRIEIAKGRARPNLSFKVGNVYDLSEFATDHFNVVYMNAVFHWLPEKCEPLRQIHRVLKPWGRLGISTAAKGHCNRLAEACCEVLSRAPYNKYQDIQQLVIYRVDIDELKEHLCATGFFVQTLDQKDYQASHLTPEAAIKFVQASSFGNFLGHLPERLQAQAFAEISAELERFRKPDGIADGGVRILAVAIKVQA